MTQRPASRPQLWLLVLPFIWQVALIPFANGVTARPFGLPFPMVWQMAGIVFASAVIAIVHRIDGRMEARGETSPPEDAE